MATIGSISASLADEIIVTTNTFSLDERLASYERLASALGLRSHPYQAGGDAVPEGARRVSAATSDGARGGAGRLT